MGCPGWHHTPTCSPTLETELELHHRIRRVQGNGVHLVRKRRKHLLDDFPTHLHRRARAAGAEQQPLLRVDIRDNEDTDILPETERIGGARLDAEMLIQL